MSDTPNSRSQGRIAAALCVLALGVAIWAGVALRRHLPAGDENPFEYNLDAFKKVDPALILYRETEPIRTELTALRGLSVTPEGRILVVGDAALLILDRDGTQLARVELGAPARCVAAGKDGLIYLGMSEHVEVRDANGAPKATWESLGENAFITALAAGGDDLYIADAGGRVVWHFSAAGALLGRIGEEDKAKGIPGFLIPSPYFDVAIDPGGFLWATNPGRHTLECFSRDGQLHTSWNKEGIDLAGFCGCCNPTNLTILADGSVVTSEKGVVRVKIYKSTGVFEGVVAAPALFADDTVGLDLAADAAGRILVLDPKKNLIRTFVRK